MPWTPSFDGARLRLTLAIGEYDHVRDLCTGAVPVAGATITPLHPPTEEIFHRFIRYREWEVSEMSFAKYVAFRARGDDSLRAIPVFPSRMFRHSSIYVRRDGPVRVPADLAGKRIGVPEWAQTAAVYSRGLLAEEYGIDLAGIEWVQAGVNQKGRPEKIALDLPPGIRLTRRPDASLDEMLRTGALDAVLSAHPPASFEAGDPAIARLFADPAAEERGYYERTGIFPIMHVVAIRAAVLDRFPWIAMNLLDAFEAAKRRSQARMVEYTASRLPVPWAQMHAERIAALFGADPWPYGLEGNVTTLEAFLRWAHVQGVAARHLTPAELFPPETLSRVRV
jgi:4,5-dihydroxyphthalate decarboxylase